jgi:hypothetical protein
VVSFPQVFPLKPCMHLFSPPYVPHVLPISVFLTWSPECCLGRTKGSVRTRGLCVWFVT